MFVVRPARPISVRSARIVAVGGLILAVAMSLIGPASAQKASEQTDAFFKKHELVHINLEIGPKEMDALRREPRKYVKANLQVGEKDPKTTFTGVGVHLKGAAGSFRGVDDKPGLTINMDKFDNENLFHGMDKFHLANSVQDPSYIAELFCGELMMAAGVPASRCGHAVVSINGKRKGFYYLKEGYDKAFLKRHFNNKTGNFYDGGFLRDIDQPLQLVSGKEATKPHDELKALMNATREADLSQRYAKMAQLLDLEKFLSYLALEVFMWDWDGYPMNRNNYRIYHNPDTNKITFIPSGMDQMFHDPNGPLRPGFQGVVARTLLETPEGKAGYYKRLDEILKTVARPELLLKRLDELQAKVQPMLASVDANAGRDYPNQINRFRGAIQHRHKKLTAELEARNAKK